MIVSHQESANGCHSSVWFSENSIPNIIAMSDLRLQYLVTYRSDEMMFIVHRESEGNLNMQFRMHENSLHYFKKRDQEFTFVNTVYKNKTITAIYIEGAEATRSLYAILIYPSDKDHKWIICSNQINNCPVTAQDVDVAQTIWCKNIAVLKGNTTQRKSNVLARDQVNIPVVLIKFHKEVFLIWYIFFVNRIQLFLTLSQKMYFM